MEKMDKINALFAEAAVLIEECKRDDLRVGFFGVGKWWAVGLNGPVPLDSVRVGAMNRKGDRL